jgi:nucleoside-diphosphate-sugar epimerase
MDSILITGVNGFVGSAIAETLRATGAYTVTGTDIQEEPDPRRASGGTYFPADITDRSSMDALAGSVGKCDVVLHAAARINSVPDLLDVNVIGTNHVAQMALDLGVKRFIYLSSIQVIGRPPARAITESEPALPLTVYHASKYFGERLLALPEFERMQPVIFRIPSPIGAGMSERTILRTFLSRCRRNEPLAIYGAGSRVQNYLDVRDIAHAVHLANGAPASPGLYHISGTSVSNIELAKLCVEVTGSGSEITFADRPDPEEHDRWILSGEKALRGFGFEPRISLAQSLLDIYRERESDTP